MSQRLDGVRKAAKERKQERFTALLHHLSVELLRDSFYALQRKASPGIDGVRWEEYEPGLEDRLVDLHSQAMQDPQFAEYAAQASGVDVEWNPAIGTAVAAQANSPVVVAYLSNNPALAQDIAAMPVARGVAEVAKLSAWLQVQLQQPQTAVPPPRRSSMAPPPIKPLGGNPTATTVVDLSTCDFQTYKRVREQQQKGRR